MNPRLGSKAAIDHVAASEFRARRLPPCETDADCTFPTSIHAARRRRWSLRVYDERGLIPR